METKQKKEFLDKKDLETIYGFKLGKVNSLIRSRSLPFYKIGREVRFKKDDVEMFFEQHKIQNI